MLQIKVYKNKEPLVFWLLNESQYDKDLHSDFHTLNLIRQFCIEYDYKFHSALRAEESPGSEYLDEFGTFVNRFKEETQTIYALQKEIDFAMSEYQLNLVEKKVQKLQPPDILSCLYSKIVGLQAEIFNIKCLAREHH